MLPGWLSENMMRTYPFVSGSTNQAVSGPATLNNLSNTTIVDFGCTLGYAAQFDVLTGSVQLTSISRSGSTFSFTMSCGSLPDIVFTATLSQPVFTTEYLDSTDIPQTDAGHGDSVAMCFGVPEWSAFLVVGDLTALAALLPDGDTLHPGSIPISVEPATIINLSGALVGSIRLANDDRTRATAPVDCAAIGWSFELGETRMNSLCIVGSVWVKGGYNCSVQQDNFSNAIVISAEAGFSSGSTQPSNCGPIGLFHGDTVPLGGVSSQLDGSLLCSDTVQTINGIGGQQITFTGGTGVLITTDPSTNTVIININMTQLAVCTS